MLSALLSILVAAQEPAPPRFPGFPEQDAVSYDVDLDVRLEQRRLRGTVHYRFRALEDLEQIRLHAARSPQWKVAFRGADGAPLEAVWGEDGVRLGLGRTVPAGEDVRFRAELRGTPRDGFYFADNRYGDRLAFTDHYSIRARGWLPCEDHPGDRARFRVALTFPAGNRAIASGVSPRDRSAAALADGRAVLRTETRSDIPPYMLAIVVGPFAEVREKGDPRLVPHLIYREDVETARQTLVHHAEWLEIMERTFGPYAYGKYAVVQCPTRWGGFEAPGNVLINERLFEFPGRGVGTLAHELTHMWFGDAVGYAQWREVWLSEGFASYFGPWLRAQTGGPTLRQSLRRMRDRWRRADEGKTKSVRWDGFGHPDEALNANTYPKGAWVLHMLRGELGDETFFDAIASFYRDHRGSSVVTEDFETGVERSAGRELDWFFDQWLDRAGCPQLEVEAAGDAIVVEQVQQGPPYRFRLTLQWTDAAGENRRRTFEIRERRVELEVGEGGARAVVVDPDVELLFRGRG